MSAYFWIQPKQPFSYKAIPLPSLLAGPTRPIGRSSFSPTRSVFLLLSSLVFLLLSLPKFPETLAETAGWRSGGDRAVGRWSLGRGLRAAAGAGRSDGRGWRAGRAVEYRALSKGCPAVCHSADWSRAIEPVLIGASKAGWALGGTERPRHRAIGDCSRASHHSTCSVDQHHWIEFVSY